VSSVVSEGASSLLEKASSSAEEVLETVSSTISSATEAVKNAVPTPSADEQDTYSEKIQNLTDEAGERLADVTKAMSEALLKQSTQGNVESATSVAAEQYSSVLAAASAAVHGKDQGAAANMASVLSEKYAEASSV
jgi:type IV secretory pathway VirB4 component